MLIHEEAPAICFALGYIVFVFIMIMMIIPHKKRK